MITKINCPVCDHPDVEGDICPNCETNLSVFRLMDDLPPVSPFLSGKTFLIPTLAILLLLLGFSLGAFATYWWATPRLSTPVVSQPTVVSEMKPKIPEIKRNCSRGFYYTVRPGDSLSLIASHFYGNLDSWNLLVDANPQLTDREDLIEVGELLLVPNLEEYFCGNF